MHTLTLHDSDELQELASIRGLKIEKFKELIIDTLIEYEAIGGDLSDAGEQIKDVSDHYMVRAAADKIFGSKDRVYVDIINRQHLLNSLGDCPQCGYEVQHDEESADGFSWSVGTCTNCVYEYSEEPDWDVLPGGYAYDC